MRLRHVRQNECDRSIKKHVWDNSAIKSAGVELAQVNTNLISKLKI